MSTKLVEARQGTGVDSTATRVAAISAPLANGTGALLLIALAAWLWIGAADIDAVGGGGLGPDTFPRLVAALLALCCLVLLIQSVRGALSRSGGSIEVSRPVQVVAAIVLVCVYPPLIGALGYYLATVLWMPPFLFLAGMRKPIGILASVAGFLLFAKVMFQMALGIPLP